MSHHLYAYGTLQVPAIMAHVVGRELVGRPARLRNYVRYRIEDRPYPAIVEAPGGEVDGVVYWGVEAAELERLDSYEGHFYERREVTVWIGDRSIAADTYVLRSEHAHRLSSEPWDLARFEREHLDSYLSWVRRTSRAP
jgi:gamma-glutamylcyclotransferase (GGCT)/AIG2-like uncharacterized protein YtfP